MVQGGVGLIANTDGSKSVLDFGGIGFDLIGAEAGGGIAAGPGWVGLYYEGGGGGAASGGGVYLNTSCN